MHALDIAVNDTTSSFMACEAPLLVSAVRNLANKRFAYVALCAAALALIVCIFAVFRIVRLAWNHYKAFMAKNGPILATICILHFVSLLIIIPLLLSTIVPSKSWCSSRTASRKVKVLAYILQSLSQCSTQCWLLACIACYAPSRQRRLPFRLSSLRYYGPLAAFLASLLFNAWTPFSVGNGETGCEVMKHVKTLTAVEFAWSFALPLAILLAMSAAIFKKHLNLASDRNQKLKQRSPTGFLNQANLIGLPMLSRFRPVSRRSSMPSVMQNLRRSMRRSVKRATKKVRDTKSQKAFEFSSGSTKNLLDHLIPSAGNSRRSSARSSFSIAVPVRPQHTAFWRVIAVTAVHLLLKTPFAIWRMQAALTKSGEPSIRPSYFASAALVMHVLQFLFDVACVSALMRRSKAQREAHRPKAASLPSGRPASPRPCSPSFGGLSIPSRSRRESTVSSTSRRVSSVTTRTADGILVKIEKSERIIRDAVSRSSFCNLVVDYGSIVRDGALQVAGSDVKTRIRSLSQTYSSNRLSAS